ncbi:M20/M25/M40 family metallo-hydrolase [Nocardiopsis gilva]|nr:M20/M25/M40 family metallo-hydrolase [Nocardiopsis gilva]
MRKPESGRSPRRAHTARRRLLAGGTTIAAALVMGLGPAAAQADTAQLPVLVTVDNVRAHMENLETIAEYNGGNRASGTAGYDVSAKYVIDQLKRSGYKPKKHTFEFDSWKQHSDPVLSVTKPEPKDFVHEDDFSTMTYSTGGEATAAGVPVNTDSGESGCSADDFTAFPEGAIAVIKRGGCTFAAKTQNAADAGAVGAIIYNNQEGLFAGTVSELSDIPVVGASDAVGAELVAAGSDLELHLKVDAEVVTESSYNVIAETKGGRKDNVVVVGAHLDSVEDGPGVNDNGSGTAGVLETAKQLAKLGKPRNKVRFAFWGTEEQGLIGSTKYVEGLNAKQLDDIALYLNFDMIGSNNYGRFVYDGRGELEGSLTPPSGSAAIQKTFEDYFDSKNQVSEPTEFSGRSDYSAFMENDIPSGGLFSGGDSVKTEKQVEYYGGTAGTDFDPYYHTPDDTIENINWDSVDELSDALAYSVERFSKNTLPVNGVAPRTLQAPVQADMQFDRQGDHWLR